MPEWTQVYSKAITALLTSLIMAWIKSRIDIAALGGDAALQTVVSMTMDGISALVIGFMTWLLPLGEKYWRQKVLGEQVSIISDAGHITSGTVIEVAPKQEAAP